MAAWLAQGIGLVLVFEGLIFALFPARLDDLVAAMAALGRDRRRLIGLVALALGVGLVWLSQHLG